MLKALPALFFLFVPATSASALPPPASSGKLVIDAVPELRAALISQEREFVEALRDFIQGKIDWRRVEGEWRALAEPRARLAEAEGRLDTAARQWRKVLAVRESRLKRNVRGCGEDLTPLLRGHVAEARCHLAEIARDNATLAAELPHLVTYYQKKLQIADELRAQGAFPAETTPDERYIQQQLRNTLRRLDVVKKRLRPE